MEGEWINPFTLSKDTPMPTSEESEPEDQIYLCVWGNKVCPIPGKVYYHGGRHTHSDRPYLIKR